MKRSTVFLMCLSLVVMTGLFSLPSTVLAEKSWSVSTVQEASAAIVNNDVVNTNVTNWVTGEVSRVSLAGARVNQQSFTATPVRWFKKFKEKLKGEQGEPGPPGPQGEQGPKGDPGDGGAVTCPCEGLSVEDRVTWDDTFDHNNCFMDRISGGLQFGSDESLELWSRRPHDLPTCLVRFSRVGPPEVDEKEVILNSWDEVMACKQSLLTIAAAHDIDCSD